MTTQTCESLISSLELLPHPEGGWYREVYRSESKHTGANSFPGQRNYATSIYFMLNKHNFSALHRIKSDELWYFHAGDPLEIVEITITGKLIITNLGPDHFQYAVKAGHWFGSRVAPGGDWSLVGCMVAPGFDFRDFEMADRNVLLSEFPEHDAVISQMTR